LASPRHVQLLFRIRSAAGAEGNCIIRAGSRRAGPERSLARFIVRKDVRVGATTLEILIELNAGGWARRSSVVLAGAAVRIPRGRVTQALVASTCASLVDILCVLGSLELRWTPGVQIGGARCLMTVRVARNDGERNVEAVYNREVVVIYVSAAVESKLCKCGGSCSTRSALETSVAATGEAGTRTADEGAIGAAPDASRGPTITD